MVSLIQQKLNSFISNRRCTLLGIGPMSENCVNATIELANDYSVPLMLIASRRQIDTRTFGGGYVNNWTTEAFSEFVLSKDKKSNVILARDHGGPWQNYAGEGHPQSLREAMIDAKQSFEADIESGFDIIHIDPSVDIHEDPSVDAILDRVYELYDFCWSLAQKRGRSILFEVGTEEQTGGINTEEILEYVLKKLTEFCTKEKFPFPTFIVGQTGTKVMETRNIGSFDFPFQIEDELPACVQLPRMIKVCNRYGVYLKEHNADYLSDNGLAWHPKLGIHAANVAPEFGVCETISFVDLLRSNELGRLAEDFLELAYKSKKWAKWMLPDTPENDEYRGIISGHYVFSTQEFCEIKDKAKKEIKNINIDSFLKEKVKESIKRYLFYFRIINHR